MTLTTHEQAVAEEREARERLRRLERARRAKREKAKREARQRPQRVRVVEGRMREIGDRIRATPVGQRWPLYKELRELANERLALLWSE